MMCPSSSGCGQVNPKVNVRNDAKYQEAVTAFYAGDFGKANGILTQSWNLTP